MRRLGALSAEQQDRVLAASEPLEDGTGLPTQQWHRVMTEAKRQTP